MAGSETCLGASLASLYKGHHLYRMTAVTWEEVQK